MNHKLPVRHNDVHKRCQQSKRVAHADSNWRARRNGRRFDADHRWICVDQPSRRLLDAFPGLIMIDRIDSCIARARTASRASSYPAQIVTGSDTAAAADGLSPNELLSSTPATRYLVTSGFLHNAPLPRGSRVDIDPISTL